MQVHDVECVGDRKVAGAAYPRSMSEMLNEVWAWTRSECEAYKRFIDKGEELDEQDLSAFDGAEDGFDAHAATEGEEGDKGVCRLYTRGTQPSVCVCVLRVTTDGRGPKGYAPRCDKLISGHARAHGTSPRARAYARTRSTSPQHLSTRTRIRVHVRHDPRSVCVAAQMARGLEDVEESEVVVEEGVQDAAAAVEEAAAATARLDEARADTRPTPMEVDGVAREDAARAEADNDELTERAIVSSDF